MNLTDLLKSIQDCQGWRGRTFRREREVIMPHELVEGNTWGDRYWGVYNGQGKNWLGRLLMQVRGEIDAD